MSFRDQSPADAISPDQQEQLQQQHRMAEQIAKNRGAKKVSQLPPDPQAATLTLPPAKRVRERTFLIPQDQPEEHVWLLKILFYEIRIRLVDLPEITFPTQYGYFESIFEYLIQRETKPNNRLNVINDFVIYRSEKGLVSSGCALNFRMLLKNAAERGNLTQHHGEACSGYVYDLLKHTRQIHNTATKSPALLARWFADQAWLRDPEIGIGPDAFSLLESPKATIGSLRVLAEETILLSISIKSAFVEFVKRNHINVETIKFEDALWNDSYHERAQRQKARSDAFQSTLDLVSPDFDNDPTLRHFAELLAYSQLTDKALSQFHVESCKVNKNTTPHRRGSQHAIAELNFHVVVELIRYAHGETNVMPTMDIEQRAFSWLLAIMTVQESDIPKLRRSDFRFTRSRGGSITSFECTYYKGRARTEHPLKMVNNGTRMFEAIAQYVLSRFPDGAEDDLVLNLKKAKIVPTALKRWFVFLDDCLGDKTKERFAHEGESSVMFDALVAMARNGLPYRSKSGCSTPENRVLPAFLFSNNSIKTTSVYANSDGFDFSKLINWHSHTNATEIASYLTPNNMEWLDRCGRVTRLVMLDLARHIYTVSTNKDALNTDLDAIRQKSAVRQALMTEMTQVMTGRSHGQINDLSAAEEDHLLVGLKVPSFMLDSPSQVALNLHYIADFEKKAVEIAQNNPTFFLEEALPKVEILETLFAEGRFSSFDAGRKIYDAYGHKFPPAFQAEIEAGS